MTFHLSWWIVHEKKKKSLPKKFKNLASDQKHWWLEGVLFVEIILHPPQGSENTLLEKDKYLQTTSFGVPC